MSKNYFYRPGISLNDDEGGNSNSRSDCGNNGGNGGGDIKSRTTTL